ncbi:hypothetical protein [Urbifossiella limnaea]|nr:hypothetical protein [Urbifossiella limnaea]
MTILLRRDPDSGKQNIIVKLDSDPDALPVEHENLHRTLVEKLVGKGVNAEDLGEIVIVREPAREPAAPAAEPDAPQRHKSSNPG